MLGHTCSEAAVRKSADRLIAALADLRSSLTDVVHEAHQGAAAAEEWVSPL
ncbi:hypothetical protein [Microtetraspora malaysiensis]|uniref:Uncharacterized protein n=1 Tax=Microtetraspora malaysiensis TaxID=161358 RepID=A0ABW6T487_9ACTN